MSQITIQHLDFTYDGDHTPVFQDLDLQLDSSWKLGLVGRNGRGKTTLLRLLEGELSGTGTLQCPERPVYFPRPVEDCGRTAREVLLEDIPPEEEWKFLRELNKLGLGEEVLERPFQSLSGGEQTRARLAALFCTEEGYPLIDEPTNHLDEAGRALVARYLQGVRRGFLLVSHDRTFLDGCVDHILALNPAGQELIRGNFSTWYQEKSARDRREEAQNERLRGEIQRLEKAAQRTSNWSDRVEKSKYRSENSGLKVDRGFVGHRSAKMMKRSKSISARQAAALEEKQGLLKDVERADSLKLFPKEYPGGRLLELRDVAVCYGGRPVSAPCSFQVGPGDRIALLGGKREWEDQPAPADLGGGAGLHWRAAPGFGIGDLLCVPALGPPVRLPGRLCRGAGDRPHSVFYGAAKAGLLPRPAGAGCGGVQRGTEEESPAGCQPVPVLPSVCVG